MQKIHFHEMPDFQKLEFMKMIEKQTREQFNRMGLKIKLIDISDDQNRVIRKSYFYCDNQPGGNNYFWAELKRI